MENKKENAQETVLYGCLRKFQWRDEKNGASRLALETAQGGLLDGQFRCEKSGAGLHGAIPWREVSVNALKAPCQAFDADVPIRAFGRFEPKDGEYQWDFVATKVEPASSPDAAVRFLATKIGSLSAARTVIAEVGDDVYSYATRQEALDALMRTVGAEKARRTIATIKRILAAEEVWGIFSPQGVPFPHVLKAIAKYGPKAADRIREDPYGSCRALGIGFHESDQIALRMNVNAYSMDRLAYAQEAAVHEVTGNGHTRLPVMAVQRAYEKVAGLGDGLPLSVRPEIGLRIVPGATEQEGSAVLVDRLDEAERRTCANLFRLSGGGRKRPYPEGVIPEVEKRLGISFGAQQVQAVARFLGSPGICILTGGPGTGKTTTLNGALAAYEEAFPGRIVKCCATTGRAAQKMSESTGRPAVTVHRILEVRPFGNGYICRGAENPVEADLLVVDELSMIDIETFDMLLEAIRAGTDLWLVGDPDQLEAVGPGAVLYDLLCQSDRLMTVCQLTEVFRQKAGSAIIRNAAIIRDGGQGVVSGNDFGVANFDNPDRMIRYVVRKTAAFYNPDDPFETQVLAPSQKGTAGINLLNKEIQAAVNPLRPGERPIIYGGREYRPRDKVIMTHNNYDDQFGYFNGDVGVIRSCEQGALRLKIRGREVTVPRSMLDEVRLAYAMTIHKSQGSDFKNVMAILPADMAHMMGRNLLYTAITRAREAVLVVNEGECLNTAIRNVRKGIRRTYLQQYIEQEKARRGMRVIRMSA